MGARALWLLALVLAALVAPGARTHAHKENINFKQVQSWAGKIGADLWHFGEYVTRRDQVQESFKTAQIETRDGNKLVDEMATDICNMMALKVSAVKRIMDAAENMAVSQENAPLDKEFSYYNSKGMLEPGQPNPTEAEPVVKEDDDEDTIIEPEPKRIVLTPNPHFYNASVNTSFSSVHIPTNVYHRSDAIIRAIKWSENLDSIFTSNYRDDPSLSWQYFGSSTGFMRHYPAMKWKDKPVDLFDCRTRAWYIEAATSSKDIIILVDNSGSMTGQRYDIARHVVENILDTLGNNDFVNIFKFNDTVMELVPCFAESLVQATLGNVRELKSAIKNVPTQGIANFTAALMKAFELLEVYREEKEGARCNQAIMLISDGVPYNFKEIFETYNWKERPMMPVRVFTYLIGREVPDVREVKWMACANQGYYVHLSTMAEVREQVLQYVPVMARPLVLWGDEHPIIWTPVYADVEDPKMMDYLWEREECEEQENVVSSYQSNSNLFLSKEQQDKRFVLKQKRREDQHGKLHRYQLMTSVSMPVFDRTRNATRIANLLGVAGTDVPIQDIQALMMPHQLGVNGYAFIVTNNGYILIHPDLRPVFQGILKPSYNSVDMAEVELMDDDNDPRDFSPELIRFRDEIIKQTNGSQWMQVKYHYDGMKRVSRIRRQYFWKGIPNSPFSLVVALPEPYGLHRISLRPEDDIHRNHVKGINVSNYFQGIKWRVHPDWVYCRHHEKTFDSPEEELLYFLNRMMGRWGWPLKPSPPEQHCDRSLMQAVVFDAKVTNWFSDNITGKKEGKELIQRFGITVAFMATHSGLTRWQSFPKSTEDDIINNPEFGEMYPRAIDEIWYRRAVEQHYMEPQSFVYSVPFNASEQILEDDGPGPLVTATHAVFHTVDKQSAPAAVVGFQFHHTRLHSLFTNITSTCFESATCPKTCKSEDLECYVVDNNGYVIVSEMAKDAGRFFGEVKSSIMRQLIEEKIFRQVHLTDYQAVCFQESDTSNPASQMLTPFVYFGEVLRYFMAYFFWIWQQTGLLGSYAYGYSYPSDEVAFQSYESETESANVEQENSKTPPTKDMEKEFERLVKINRTKPTPCDQEVFLYQLQQYPDRNHTPYKNFSKGCDRPYVVQEIPGSNLILVVIDGSCYQELVPPLRPVATPVAHNDSLPCTRAGLPLLSRRRLSPCIRHHPNESEIESCGLGTRITGFKLVHVLFASLMTMLSSLLLIPARPSLKPL